MSKKFENTRIVTFEKDYKLGNQVLYKGGVEYAIHNATVEKLQKRKVNLTARKLDVKAAQEKAAAVIKATKEV
jgi:hypothetical protein